MDINKLSETIRSLATNEKKRKKIAQLRDIFDDIEIALAAGVTKSILHEELNNSGFEINFNTFINGIKIIRKERESVLKESETHTDKNSEY